MFVVFGHASGVNVPTNKEKEKPLWTHQDQIMQSTNMLEHALIFLKGMVNENM